MKIMLGGKNSGKTTKLVKVSAREKIHIICSNFQRKFNILDVAKKLKLDIPEPITLCEVVNNKLIGINDQRILIDDAEIILTRLLLQYMSPYVNVDVITIDTSKENLYTEEKL